MTIYSKDEGYSNVIARVLSISFMGLLTGEFGG